jgi:hypothetical protein
MGFAAAKVQRKIVINDLLLKVRLVSAILWPFLVLGLGIVIKFRDKQVCVPNLRGSRRHAHLNLSCRLQNACAVFYARMW